MQRHPAIQQHAAAVADVELRHLLEGRTVVVAQGEGAGDVAGLHAEHDAVGVLDLLADAHRLADLR